MPEYHRTHILFNEQQWKQASELAQSNFPDGRNAAGGSVKDLLMHLVWQAYHEPEKFGLVPPGAGTDSRPSISEELTANRAAARHLFDDYRSDKADTADATSR